MTELQNLKLIDLGITLTILIVIVRAAEFGLKLWLSKKIPTPKTQSVTLACQQDPMHYQRIKEMHQATMDTEKKKQHGDFECMFKDRDEVRDLIEMIRASVQATKELTQEMRLTRNGKSRR